MVRLILGSVTLAAVGFGVKKYIEDDIDRSIAFDEVVINSAEKICDAVDDVTFKYLMPDGCAMQRDKDGVFQLIDPLPDDLVLTTSDSKGTSKQFHKSKKEIYKKSMKEYTKFIEDENIGTQNILKYTKLEKQEFFDSLVDEKLNKYLSQISSTLEILANSLSLQIHSSQNLKSKEDEVMTELNKIIKAITKLVHLKLFDANEHINDVEVLSTLVDTMGLISQKKTIHL